MLNMKKLVLVSVIAVAAQLSNAHAQHPSFKVWGDSLEVYNSFTFSPDGKKLYTSEPHRIHSPDSSGLYLPRWGAKNRPWVTLFEYDLNENNLPINRRKLAFANDSLDSSPHINFAGNRIYFSSRRPVPGSDELDGVMHVWYSDKSEDGSWSPPRYFEEINRANYYSAYAQELSDGSILYQSNIPGGVVSKDGTSSQDLWISKYEGGKYGAPENVTALNSAIHEDQLVVNQASTLVLFTRYDEKEMHLFYSTKEGGSWTEPVELLITDVSGFKEQSPRLSIDEDQFCFAHGLLLMCAPLEEVLKMNTAY